MKYNRCATAPETVTVAALEPRNISFGPSSFVGPWRRRCECPQERRYRAPYGDVELISKYCWMLRPFSIYSGRSLSRTYAGGSEVSGSNFRICAYCRKVLLSSSRAASLRQGLSRALSSRTSLQRD